jgi:quercetin dioxygenase-like cupin family protein
MGTLLQTEGDRVFHSLASGVDIADLGIAEKSGSAYSGHIVRIQDAAGVLNGMLPAVSASRQLRFGYVIKGSVQLRFDDDWQHHLQKGDSFHLEADARWSAVANGDAEILLLSAPISAMLAIQPFVTTSTQPGFGPGLRDYFLYRDLGVRRATSSKLGAHVVQAVAGKHVDIEWHVHDVDFQFLYILEGWIECAYEDIGTVRIEKSTVVYQPPVIRHTELSQSDDVTILTFVVPGRFQTRLVPRPD